VPSRISIVFLVLIGCALVGVGSGCATQDNAAPANAPQQNQAQAAAPQASPPSAEDKAAKLADAQKKLEDLEKELADLHKSWGDQEEDHQRGLERARRNLDVAKMRLQRAQMSVEDNEQKQEAALSRARQELEFAERRLDRFVKLDMPARVFWGELGLARTGDYVQEQQDELKQLELMYAEEDFADQTKEIVLDRSRRRVERAKRDIELRQTDHQKLVDVTLPFEQDQHQHNLREAHRRLEATERGARGSRLDHEIGLSNARSTVADQEVGLDKTIRDWERKTEKHHEKVEELQEKIEKARKAVEEAES
jgi:hypothetical protein